jgi:hypothetical protein
LIPLGEDTFLVDAARFSTAEILHDDGDHADVVLMVFAGHYNAPDAVAPPERVELRVMIRLGAAGVFAAALQAALDAS